MGATANIRETLKAGCNTGTRYWCEPAVAKTTLIEGVEPMSTKKTNAKASGKNAKSAKSGKSASAGTKIRKAVKAKGAPAEATEAPTPRRRRASDPENAAPRANRYAGMSIKPLVKSAADAGVREGSKHAALLDAVLAAKKVDDVIGTVVTSANGTEYTVTGSVLGYFQRIEQISLQ